MTKSKAVKALESQLEEQEQVIEQMRNDAAANHRAMELMEEKLDARLAESQRIMQDQFAQMMNALQRRPSTNDTTRTETASTSNSADTIEVLSERDDMQSRGRPSRNPGRGNRIFDYSKIEAIPEDAEYHDFRVWRERWDANAKNKTMELFSRDEQVTALMDAIGHAAAGIVKSYTSVDLSSPDTTVEQILNALREYYRKNRSIIADGVDFRKRTQGDNESFTKFRCALDELADDAELCNHCRERQIVEQIIVGIRDDTVKDKLLEIDPYPTLEEAVKICHKAEIASKNRKCIDARKEVCKVSSYKKNKQRDRSESRNRHNSRDRNFGCKYCGGDKHPREKCRAKDKTCDKCGVKGHFKSVCRAKDSCGNDTGRGRSKDRTVSSIFCGRIMESSPKSSFCDLPSICVNIYDVAGKSLGILKDVLPDTGAGANLMGVANYKKLGGHVRDLRRQQDILYGANGLTINTLGRAEFMIEHGNEKVSSTFVITDEYRGTLLNQATCKALKIIHESFPNKVHVNATSPTGNEIQNIYEELLKEFADVFDSAGKLKAMKGPPINIELTEDAKPFRVNGVRPIPIPLREGAKKLIFELVEKGVLQEETEPTDWLHPFTIVRKTDDSLRLCVDLRMLNKFVKRPVHPVTSPKEAIASIPPGAKYFTVFDAKSGYFQCELNEKSQKLTCFLTPWGRFKHLRATMGLSCAGDEFNRRTDAALAGLSNMSKVVDDIIVYGSDLEEHINDVRQLLLRCRESGITLNKKKFQLAKNNVKFAGYVVTDHGIKADPDKVKAITHFPKPSNITDMRSFKGLVEQMGGFSKEVAEAMQPLRPLLSQKAEFYWTSDHDKAFEATKKALTSPPILATFDPKRPTRLETDASRTKGLGYILMQKDDKNQWRMIEANSRFISETEARYAMVELELLGVKWAMKKCHSYLFGLPHFDLIVDHQPLVSILDKQTLDSVDNSRIQRLKTATAPYNFTTTWKKGKEHRIPDALSRAPIQDPSQEDLAEDEEIYKYMCTVQRSVVLAIDNDTNDTQDDDIADKMLQEIKDNGRTDEEVQALEQYLRGDGEQVPKTLSHMKAVLSEMSADKGLILFRQRLFIPRNMRKNILQRLHSSHQGVDRTLRRARQTVFWPGISSDIKSTVDACKMCQYYRPSQPKEPMKSDEPPSRIFEHVAADFFELDNHHYLAMADRYSGWLEIFDIGKPATSQTLIRCLKEYFVSKGCPVKLFSDGGKQFVSEETQRFLEVWNVQHRLSSPGYPQSNGLAESGVKVLKALLKKCHGKMQSREFAEGLLELRNTPRVGGKSPAEIVFGHPLRSRVPAHHSSFDPKWLVSLEEHDKRTAEDLCKRKELYDRSAKPLTPLNLGTSVIIQNAVTKKWDKTGKVVTVGPNRNYRIRQPSGRCVWRNRKFLRGISTDADGAKHDQETAQEKEFKDAEKSLEKPKVLRRSKRVRFKVDRLRY